MVAFGVGVHVIHEEGRKIERTEWLARENKELIDKQQLLEAAAARNQELAEQNAKLNDEAV